MRFRFLLFITLFPFILYSQGVNNLWIFGNDNHAPAPFGGGVMNFSGGILSMYPQNRIMNFYETNGVITNSSGNLLFASNGIFIMNSANDTMVNGSNLNPGYFTNFYWNYGLTIPQGNLIIPMPGDPSKYYLFHETADDYPFSYCPFYLYYSIIDMSLQGGLGEVVTKNNVLISDSLTTGKLTACKHANGRDWWLIAHRYNNDLYYKFLITPWSIQGPYMQNIGAARGNSLGQCVFSPDGNLFAYYEPVDGDLDIFHFDRCTGDFTMKAHVDINDSAVGGGVAFSSSSQMLYVSSMNYVYQFDMNASNIEASKFTVAVYDGFVSYDVPLATTFYLSHLAPDGKIYINSGNSSRHLHVINQPEAPGHASALCQHCIHLPVKNAFTMPNHPNYFLGAKQGTVCDSLTSGIQESEKQFSIKVFPNPVFENELSLSYAVQSTSIPLSVYDIHGREVFEYYLPAWSSVQKIKLPELNRGIYVAKVANASVKFVIQ